MQSGNKVILNTAILYIKMAISIVLGLYSTRLILQALGVEDYGLYNLISGIVSMLSFLNTSLAASTQRFLSYSLGKDDIKKVSKVFYYSVVLHIAIAFIVILLIEIIGAYGIQNWLVIDNSRIETAISVLHLLSISIFFTIIAVPYMAVLISRENMLLLSISEILQAILKLGAALFLLQYLGNKLLIYSLMIALIMILSLVFQIILCNIKYPEVHFHWQKLNDKSLFKSLLSYAGWYSFAPIGSIGRFQGIPIIMNIFFGVVANAAYGIANQVNGLMQFFATAIMQSIRPQITKSEGSGNRQRSIRLSLIACKYMYFLCALFTIPVMLEAPYILKLWLGNVPLYTIEFCRLVLLATLCFMISNGLNSAVDATGNIKYTYVIVGCLHFLILPIGYILYKIGLPINTILWVVVIEELICMIVRIICAKLIVGVSIKEYIIKVLIPISIVTVTSVIFGIIPNIFLSENFMRLLLTCIIYGLSFIITSWMIGMDTNEKQHIIQLLHKSKK